MVVFQFTPLREGRRVSQSFRENSPISIHAPPRGATNTGTTHGARPSAHFNSRPSARGDVVRVIVLHRGFLFQFTPLREGRQPETPTVRKDAVFQFTPLREGRRHAAGAAGSPPAISIHAPPRGATDGRTTGRLGNPNFNSRPSARGDSSGGGGRASRRISIHAPPRGATRGRSALYYNHKISIHAPPRGATSGPVMVSPTLLFQFTPLREGRRQ